MAISLRRVVLTLFGVLWVSGCTWLVLHYIFPHQGDFGPESNPWEPLTLRVHGWLAMGGVFLLGWLGASHISDRWWRSRRRVSGWSLVSLAALLVLSGYALYYTIDRLRDVASVVHESLGALAILVALIHWQRHRRSSRPTPTGTHPVRLEHD
jgi:hypothetical protein